MREDHILDILSFQLAKHEVVNILMLLWADSTVVFSLSSLLMEEWIELRVFID